MTDPSIFDLLGVGLNDGLSVNDLTGRQANGRGQMDNRCEPKLGFAIWMCDVNVDEWLFAGKEEQAERAIAYDGRCHAPTLEDSRPVSKRHDGWVLSERDIGQPHQNQDPRHANWNLTPNSPSAKNARPNCRPKASP
jgi:hypothetical protein